MPPRKTNTTTRNIWKNTNTRTCTQYACNSPKYRIAKNECQCRIGSYRNVYSQINTGTRTTWSPATANRWVKYVNSGVRVYRFTTTDFNRYFGTKWGMTPTATTRNYLRRKYGTGVKDVTRGTNCWLIATTRNVTGRPFNTYNWR
jgi:hypothetical protein